MSGVIKHGSMPNGFDLTGFPVIVRVRDNGISADDQSDAVFINRSAIQPRATWSPTSSYTTMRTVKSK